jgi:2-polyprenyl-3-methyl-5-hydroxy-6-metoxy-1,4-benzoquinol methylase
MTDFDESYFTALYGETAAQSWADRSRDRRIERLVDAYAGADTPHDALLDIGCGYGYLLERFRGRYSLYGTDISRHAVEVAGARLPEGTFAAADVQQGLPFDRLFRAILLVNVLEHLARPAEGIRSLRDALVPGGLCVVHLPTINNLANRAYYRLSYAKDATHVYRPSGAEATRLFVEQGFELCESSYAPHRPTWLWGGLKPFPPFLAAYRRVE